MLEDDVLPFDISQLSNVFHERPQENRFFLGVASMPKHADPGNLLRLLRARSERPADRCTAEKCDELSPLHNGPVKARIGN